MCAGSSRLKHAGCKIWHITLKVPITLTAKVGAAQVFPSLSCLFPALCPVNKKDGRRIHLAQDRTNQLNLNLRFFVRERLWMER